MLARVAALFSRLRSGEPLGERLGQAGRTLVALALLAGLALAACGFLLRDDLFIYGDHPGQFMRLWYPLRVSQRLLGWNPLWYAGYPELQFYPPGFVLLGWGLDRLTLGQLSPFALYQFLIFVAYLLPGISIYALVSQVTTNRWVGLVTGGLGLLFPDLWGGAGAVFVGLVAERLAFGLVPLVMLAGWKALHARRPLSWWLLTSVALTATLLMHPFHAVAPGLFLGLAALFLPRRWRLWRDLGLTAVLAVALAAFWLIPLMARGSYAAPMLRANLVQTLAWLSGPAIWEHLGAALLVPLALRMQRQRSLVVFVLSTGAAAAGLLAIMLFDHLVLVERLGFYLLDPIRFTAEVYLAMVLLAGLGLAYLPLWLSRRWQRWGLLLGGLVVVLAFAWLGQPLQDMVREHNSPTHFLAHVRQAFALDNTWQVLGSETGRILFTSYYLHVEGLPTALKAATPYFTGRPILGGTFSHWSPVARSLWVGRPDANLLPGQVELVDDLSLAGRPWSDWTDADFFDLCHRLNVTTVVAAWSDINARTFLDAAPHFQPFHADGLFVLYRVLDTAPSLVEGTGATVSLLHTASQALDLHIAGAVEGASVQIKITDYPLWRVEGDGKVLTHRADPLGLMSISLPPGSYDLSLRYEPGVAERIGAWISLGAGALWVAVLALHFRRGFDPAHLDSGH